MFGQTWTSSPYSFENSDFLTGLSDREEAGVGREEGGAGPV